MSKTDSTSTPELITDDYDVMLDQLDDAIEEITEKIESGRIRNPETDKVRIQYYRALGYLVRTKRQVLEDKTLEELAAEIEAMKTHGDSTDEE
jgi:hypothetical protein